MSNIPQTIHGLLKQFEPNSEFSGTLPLIKSSSGTNYYAKLGSLADREQYIGEAESLKVIQAAALGLAPQVFTSGTTVDGKPYMLSEYKFLRPLESSEGAGQTLAKRLATELHAYKSLKGFGFDVPTYCGATRQENGWFDNWDQCFSELLGGLLKRLKPQYEELHKNGELVRTRVIPKLLGHLTIQPVLLHGDLWSGNVGIDSLTGLPVIFDPSSYYGHNEADLAITRMFGGFPQSFFVTYHNYLPKTEPVDQYPLRAVLYELYHYLNHTVLFGGGYAQSAQSKMKELLDADLGGEF